MTESEKQAALEAIENDTYLSDAEKQDGHIQTIWFRACEWMASHAAMPAGDGWMPIETAPKDEVVLLCDEYGNRWTDVVNSDWPISGCGYPAIHYMPLPQPPKGKP